MPRRTVVTTKFLTDDRRRTPPTVAPLRHVVFFAWLGRNRTLAVDYLQLWARERPTPHLHVVVSGSADDNLWLQRQAREWHVVWESWLHYTANEFEFRGICRVWELARSLPADQWVGYFHNRGASHGPELTRANRALATSMLQTWCSVPDVLVQRPATQTIGLCHAPAGFAWFNMWWARAGYLVTLPEPTLQVRHYYEMWLSLSAQRHIEQCFSLASRSWGASVSSEGAMSLWEKNGIR